MAGVRHFREALYYYGIVCDNVVLNANISAAEITIEMARGFSARENL